jgi:hypothetical protein
VPLLIIITATPRMMPRKRRTYNDTIESLKINQTRKARITPTKIHIGVASFLYLLGY